jgi:hypothetical protein
MKHKLEILACCVSLACVGANAATPLDIKPGLWEVVRVTEQSGATQISRARVETLTSEQRKALENEFPERVPGRRQVDRTCITPQQLQIGFLPEDNPECLRTTVEQTETAMAVRMECLDTRGARKMDLRLTAPQPDRVSGAVEGDIKSASGKVAHFKVAIEARWLQDDCLPKRDVTPPEAEAAPDQVAPPDTPPPP